MLPTDNVKLFKNILNDFNKAGILQDFILIGSWALRVYSQHYDNHPGIPIIATQDLDLLVPNPPKISREVDVGAILAKYELERQYSPRGDLSKFIGVDFEVEFLYAEQGRGESGGKVIKELGIIATPLRYLNFIQNNAEEMEYDSILVKVPNPVVFVLMKYLLVIEREKKNVIKIAKDISTAKELEFFLLEQGRGNEFQYYYTKMPKKWQSKLEGVLKEYGSDLTGIINS